MRTGADSAPTLDSEADETALKERARWFWTHLWDISLRAEVMDAVSEELVFRGSLGQTVHGHGGLRGYLEQAQAAVPDFHTEIHEIIAEGDRVAVKLHFSGTHRGTLFGVPATRRPVDYAGMALMHSSGDVFDSIWVVGDTLGLLRQMGNVHVD